MDADRWAVFAVAWPPERVARMDASLARVRDWLAADGVYTLGANRTDRAALREAATGSGLTAQEAWLMSDALVAAYRGLDGPGARVQERARNVTGAVQEALGAQSGLRARRTAPRGSTGVLGRSGTGVGPAVQRYAVAEHDWRAVDPALVVEDLPWAVGKQMRAFPVLWQGVCMPPRGREPWTERFWSHGEPRPGWADAGDTGRVLAVTRALGWNGMPLRADLDDVGPYLPTEPDDVGWLIPGAGGWAFCWQMGERPENVRPSRVRARHSSAAAYKRLGQI